MWTANTPYGKSVNLDRIDYMQVVGNCLVFFRTGDDSEEIEVATYHYEGQAEAQKAHLNILLEIESQIGVVVNTVENGEYVPVFTETLPEDESGIRGIK